MPTIDKAYQSLFDYLVKKNFPFAKRINEVFRLQKYAFYEHSNTQDLGSLQPIIDIWQDVKKTFSVYKSNYHIRKDILQPIRGVGNLARGIFNLIVVPIMFLVNTIRYAIYYMQNPEFSIFSHNMSINFQRTGVWIIDGLSSVVRGALQIITCPLTYLFRIPLRSVLTRIFLRRKIRDNDGINRLVIYGNEARSEPHKLIQISNELRRKYYKSKYRGQSTDVDEKIQQELYYNITRGENVFSKTEFELEIEGGRKIKFNHVNWACVLCLKPASHYVNYFSLSDDKRIKALLSLIKSKNPKYKDVKDYTFQASRGDIMGLLALDKCIIKNDDIDSKIRGVACLAIYKNYKILKHLIENQPSKRQFIAAAINLKCRNSYLSKAINFGNMEAKEIKNRNMVTTLKRDLPKLFSLYPKIMTLSDYKQREYLGTEKRCNLYVPKIKSTL